MQRDRHLCQPCKRARLVTPATEVDHVIPEAEGGPTVASNLESTCHPCHQVKTQREALRARKRDAGGPGGG